MPVSSTIVQQSKEEYRRSANEVFAAAVEAGVLPVDAKRCPPILYLHKAIHMKEPERTFILDALNTTQAFTVSRKLPLSVEWNNQTFRIGPQMASVTQPIAQKIVVTQYQATSRILSRVLSQHDLVGESLSHLLSTHPDLRTIWPLFWGEWSFQNDADEQRMRVGLLYLQAKFDPTTSGRLSIGGLDNGFVSDALDFLAPSERPRLPISMPPPPKPVIPNAALPAVGIPFEISERASADDDKPKMPPPPPSFASVTL